MAMVRQKVGEVVGLSLQAFDGASDLYPQVTLRNTSGVLLTTLDLAHTGSGLYIVRSFLMPNISMVTAQYKVYSDAVHTTLDQDYEESLDVILRDDVASSQGIIDGTIIGVVDDSEEVFGVIDTGCNDVLIVGSVEEENLVGVVDPDDPILVGFVEGDEIIGIVDCEV